MGTTAEGRRHERWIVVSLALAGFIATLDDYIVSVSLPVIAKDFDASTSQAALVTMAYLVALVATLRWYSVVSVIESDTGGSSWPATWCSCWAQHSVRSHPSLTALIAFRVLQGCGRRCCRSPDRPSSQAMSTGPVGAFRHFHNRHRPGDHLWGPFARGSSPVC